MTIAPFPHHYAVTVSEGTLHASPRPPLPIGPPPQFGGDPHVWSPEELLVGAVLVCLKTTFDAYAQRQSIVVLGFRGDATGTLLKGPQGPELSAVEVVVDAVVADVDADRARAALQRAERDCIVSRALRAPVVVTATVSTRAPDALPDDVG